MGRHALPAAPDALVTRAAAPAAATAPRGPSRDDSDVELRRPRGRRSAFGPAVARSTFVEEAAPASIESRAPERSVVSAAAGSAAVEGAAGTAVAAPAAGTRAGTAAASPAAATRAGTAAARTAVAPPAARTAVAPSAARTGVAPPAAGATVASIAVAGSAVLSRSAALRAERAVDPKHIRRAANAKRAAVLLAPALAVTSSLTLAVPANADTPSTAPHHGTTTSQLAQTYTVARDVQVPVVQTDGMTTTTTIVSYPTIVTKFGVSTQRAEDAISAVLSAGGDRATIVSTALQYMGDRYVEGGASHAGIDCSGLTMVAYAAVGIPLVHYVPTQDAAATTIPESEAKAGDLVVYDNEDHVGIFLGDGLVLQAPHPGDPVDIVPMYSAAHHFARLLPAGS